MIIRIEKLTEEMKLSSREERHDNSIQSSVDPRSVKAKDLSVDEIELILDTAKSFSEVSQRDVKKSPALRGKTVVNLFLEPSTRTRVSIELA